MLDLKEIRSQASEAIQAQIKEMAKEIYNLENELRLNRKLDKPHLLRSKKKDRARLMLVLHEKKLEAQG
ncbi:MAG: 50S ribosomal protein L29 [Chlamydiae bacterium]|jgi:large subunit ribosomal protein L29|nr:50S ribosomal protein L29 [Chlamydiota bacterium]